MPSAIYIFAIFILISEVLSVPLENEVSAGIPIKSENSSMTVAAASELGVPNDFLLLLQQNWDKAIAFEMERLQQQQQHPDVNNQHKLRQFGGADVGEFFGLGQGQGQGQGFGGGGGGGAAEEDEEEEESGPTTPGPGAAGILTGLFGILSGVGTLNPKRVIQSTVNFFPPGQRVAAQMALDTAFGIHNTTTLAPLTDAPSRNETNKMAQNISTVVPLHTTPSSGSGKLETSTRKRLILKETSLLEDFEADAIKFNPGGNSEDKGAIKPGDKPRTSQLEQDFADTANQFKVESVAKVKEGSLNEEAKVDNSTINPIIATSTSFSSESVLGLAK